MYYENNGVKDLKIAYIGGGSRGWAWGLMSDLALTPSLSGTVYLYDIDYQAAKDNEKIGNSIPKIHEGKDNFKYKAVKTYKEALSGADFVIISILPGTFDEMQHDVHDGEEYGIYQSVGDTVGIGCIVRALRCLPMFFEFAEQIKKYCPDAFVINYTNPMALCVGALYKAFPEIKCFGCCHEVFGTKKFLCAVLEKKLGIKKPTRDEIKVNVLGVNHFTWFTEAKYKNLDIFPIYKEFCDEYAETGYHETVDNNWLNTYFDSHEMVKMNLFQRYGYIAAAGDRHLAEFCPPHWFLKNPETAKKFGFTLTPVSWRKENLQERLDKKDRLLSGEEKFAIEDTGEEGAMQMSALLGLKDFVTNANVPNRGQIPNLPLGAVVETNVRFCANSLTPVFAGNIPEEIKTLVERSADNQKLIIDAAWERDFSKAFRAFCNEPMNNLDLEESKELFNKLIDGSKKYLKEYKW